MPEALPPGPNKIVTPARRSASAGVTMLSLPNVLTLSRIVAVPLLAFLLWPDFEPIGLHQQLSLD